jgi:S1-C subfamily serine protease
MTGIDWIILVFVLLLAVYGYGQGFIVGFLSLAGFAVGAVLGTRLGPELLNEGAASPYAPLFGLVGALLAGGILALGLEGVGARLRAKVGHGALAGLDGALGAVLTAAVGLGVAWLLAAIALQLPGMQDLRPTIQRSAVLRSLNDMLPPSGPILNALARFDPVPRIAGPDASVPEPREAITRDPDVRAAAPSVVRVLGTACGLGIEGSGWVARPGVVVTNAHVVAGQDDTTVQAGGNGARQPARAVVFDERNDLAILRVPGLELPSLEIAENTEPGRPAAILGYPENGPFTIRAGRLGVTRTVVSQDAYGRGPVQRRMTAVRGVVRSGNSGGPAVDAQGRVVTTIFAATRDDARAGGYGVPNRIVREALEGAGTEEVGTGPCIR